MRRSICYCEPNQAIAGEVNTWKFIYTTASSLPKGTRLRFDLASDGRDIDWELPSVNLKDGANVIYVKLDDDKILQAQKVDLPNRFTPIYEFVLPVKLETGSNISIIVGSPKNIDKTAVKNGTHAQTYSQRRRSFFLFIDTSGKGHFADPEIFSMDIRGNVLHSIKLLSPSFVTRNKRFDVIVRFEDEYGNLTSNAPEDTLVELSYENLRENLNWKLFVPETGFITLPNLYFNEAGVYTIQLLNTKTKEKFRSAPIRCFSDNEKSLYWGLLHGESERIDSTDNIESCLRHFRDEKSLNFYCASAFEDIDETPADLWKLISQNIADFDETDRFVTLLGFQWQGENGTEGLRHFIWSKEGKPILRKKDVKNSSLKKIYKSYAPKDLISIPSFTMGKGTVYDFKDFNPDFERVVEIYNSWGSSECTKKDGNKIPIKGPAKKGVQEEADGAIQKALKENKRFGFVAGGLDDRGVYADFYENEQEQYMPGLTGIIAHEHSRGALFEALYNRSCYATTGARMIVGLYLAGFPMGSETNTIDKHGLMINRHLSGYVAGTTDLELVEIIRNGKVIKSFKPTGYSLEFTYDDHVPLEQVTIDAKDKKPPFVYYYLRATQKDGNMAWSSPIWVDYVKGKPVKKIPKPSMKPVKKLETLDEEIDDFDDIDDMDDEE
jgi:hypothetical protein